MGRNIKITLFTFVATCMLVVGVLLVKKNVPVHQHKAPDESGSQLSKYLLDRMNHKIVDTSMPKSSISFEQNNFDFGTIKSGDEVIHRFKFKNTGSNPLIIFNVKGTCGCTVPAWSNKPVNPGDTSGIVIKFNSVNESGLQNKKVRVFANSNPIETDIFFKANVIN